MRSLSATALALFALAATSCGSAPGDRSSERSLEQPASWRDLGAAARPASRLGRPASARDIADAAITIFPDGRGLPPGRGSVGDGARLYAERCAACHGVNGEGQGDFPKLVGGRGTLAAEEPVLTIGSYWPYSTSVFDYIRRAMPYNAPGSLSPDETYAVTAFLLHKNGIVGADVVLGRDNLAGVRMPNRDGFVGDPRPDVSQASVRPKPSGR